MLKWNKLLLQKKIAERQPMNFYIPLLSVLHIFLFSSILSGLQTTDDNLIKVLSVNKNILKVEINDKFKSTFLKDDFFVEYDEDIDLSRFEYEILTMPFIANVISIIWISGKNFYIDSMEKDFFDSLEKVKKVFEVIYPNTSWKGNLIPRKLVSLLPDYQRTLDDNKIACLFSGGLDSTSTYFAHLDKQKVLITAWGQYDSPLDEEQIWLERKKQIEKFTQAQNDSNAFIKSNYSEFLNWKVLNRLSPDIHSWRINAVEGIGWAGLTAPILLTKGCAHLYLPSSSCWYYPYPGCDTPFVDDNIAFAGVRLHHDQFDYARIEKCEFIERICNERNIKKPFIKVCQITKNKDDTNCCNCRKCLITIMSFYTIGAEPADYGFPVTAHTALKRTHLFLKNGVSHFTWWNICYHTEILSKGSTKE